MAVSVASLLLYAAGYFGAKLQGLECVAVMQISALLLFTVDNTHPSYSGLKYLGWSLGATPFTRTEYFYEDTNIQYSTRSELANFNCISTFNIFLLVILIPLGLAPILKKLAGTSCLESGRYTNAWKYTLGSFTFYGLLFMAYGMFVSLGLNIRHFNPSIDSLIGLVVGIIFGIVFITYLVGLFKYPIWFGAFKKFFYKFEIASHFYFFFSIERVINAFIIACLSPGFIAAVAVSCIILI